MLRVPSDGSPPVMGPVRMLHPREAPAPPAAVPAASRTAVDPGIHACVYLLDPPVGQAEGDGEAGYPRLRHAAGAGGQGDAPDSTVGAARAYFVLQSADFNEDAYGEEACIQEEAAQLAPGLPQWVAHLPLGGPLPPHHPARQPITLPTRPSSAEDPVHDNGPEATPGAAAGSALSWLLLVAAQTREAQEAPSLGRVTVLRQAVEDLGLRGEALACASVGYPEEGRFTLEVPVEAGAVAAGGPRSAPPPALPTCVFVRQGGRELRQAGEAVQALGSGAPLVLGVDLTIPVGLPGLRATPPASAHGGGGDGPQAAALTGPTPSPAPSEWPAPSSPAAACRLSPYDEEACAEAGGGVDAGHVSASLPVAQRRQREASAAANDPVGSSLTALLRSCLAYRDHATQLATASVQSIQSLLRHTGQAPASGPAEWRVALGLVAGTLQTALDSLDSAIMECPVDAHHTAAVLRLTRAALLATPTLHLWHAVVCDCSTALGHLTILASAPRHHALPPADDGAKPAASVFQPIPALQLRALFLRSLAHACSGQWSPALNDAAAVAELLLVPPPCPLPPAPPSAGPSASKTWPAQDVQWTDADAVRGVVGRLASAAEAMVAAPDGPSAALAHQASDEWSPWCRLAVEPAALIAALEPVASSHMGPALRSSLAAASGMALGLSPGVPLTLAWRVVDTHAPAGLTDRDGYWHSAAHYKGKAFVFGGFSHTSPCQELLVLNVRGGTWADLTRLPTHPPGPVYFHTATMLGERLVVLGGWGSPETGMHLTGWALDVATLTWQRLAAGVEARAAGMRTLRPPGGGDETAPAPAPSGTGPEAVEQGQVVASPPVDRISHSATRIGPQELLVLGGMHGAAAASGESGGCVFDDAWVLHSPPGGAASTWTQVHTWGPAPCPRYGHTALLWDPAGVIPCDDAPPSRPSLSRAALLAACPALAAAVATAEGHLASLGRDTRTGCASPWQWRPCSLGMGPPPPPPPDAPWQRPGEHTTGKGGMLQVPVGSALTCLRWGASDSQGRAEDTSSFLVPQSCMGEVPLPAARQALLGDPHGEDSLAGQAKAAHQRLVHSRGPYVVVYGGKCSPVTVDAAPLPTVHLLDVSAWVWLPVAAAGTPPPSPIHHAAVMLGDSMVVAGGGEPGRMYLSVAALHLPTMSWHKVRSGGAAPRQVCGHSLTVLPRTADDLGALAPPSAASAPLWWADSCSYGYGEVDGVLLLGGMMTDAGSASPAFHTSSRQLDIAPLLRLPGTAAAALQASSADLAAQLAELEEASDGGGGKAKRKRRPRRRGGRAPSSDAPLQEEGAQAEAARDGGEGAPVSTAPAPPEPAAVSLSSAGSDASEDSASDSEGDLGDLSFEELLQREKARAARKGRAAAAPAPPPRPRGPSLEEAFGASPGPGMGGLPGSTLGGGYDYTGPGEQPAGVSDFLRSALSSGPQGLGAAGALGSPLGLGSLGRGGRSLGSLSGVGGALAPPWLPPSQPSK